MVKKCTPTAASSQKNGDFADAAVTPSHGTNRKPEQHHNADMIPHLHHGISFLKDSGIELKDLEGLSIECQGGKLFLPCQFFF